MTTKYYICHSCHESNQLKTMATDRVDLERDMGENIRVACGHCHRQLTIHVNDVNAKPNVIITAVAAVAGGVAIVALWQIGFIAWISGGFPTIVYGMQIQSAKTFNSYSIQRKDR